VALSIRSPSVEKKARELARRTGGTMTEAIEEALDARLEHAAVEEVRLRTRLEGIAAICAAAPDLDTRSPEEILGYDRAGGFDHGDR
jgi:antitoxin VapB